MQATGWAELRTAVAGVDPGLERLRLAAVGSASMALAVAVMAGVRALTGRPAALRDRTAPLTGPWRRTADGYRDTLHVLAALDHYARALARLSDDVRAPEWAPLLQPAVDRVRDDLDGLCRASTRDRPAGDRDATEDDDRTQHVEVRSAEELLDAAEAWAARCADPRRRHDLLEAARLLRRIDQGVTALVGAPPRPAVTRR